MQDYPLRYTGDPYLDGVIWARGVKHNVNTTQIRLPHVPASVVDDIEQRAKAAGFETDYAFIPLKQTTEVELRLVVAGQEPIFGSLTAFRERRLPMGLPREFLVGFFTACARIPRISSATLDSDVLPLVFNVFHQPVDDALEGLASLGVTQALPDESNVTLEPADFAGIKELELLRDAFIAEERDLREEHGGTAFEVRMGKVLDIVGVPNLTRACQTTFDRLTLALRLLASTNLRDAGLLGVPAGQTPAHAQLVTDYCALTGAELDTVVQVTSPGLRLLASRYELLLGQYFRRSREGQMCKAMAAGLLDQVTEGRALVDAQSGASHFFTVRGPTDETAAQLLIQNIIPDIFEREKGGLRIAASPSTGRKALADLDGRLVKAGRAAMTLFRGLTFDEAADQDQLEVLQKCASCDEKLVLSSGQSCTECNTGLCQDCFVVYAAPQKNPNPFAADSRAAYCRVHANAMPKTSRPGYTPRALREAVERRRHA